MNITVYTKPNCVQCEQTKRFFDVKNVPYEVIDITENQEALEKVVGMGFSSAPVVITDTTQWAGFRYENLIQAVRQYHMYSKKTQEA